MENMRQTFFEFPRNKTKSSSVSKKLFALFSNQTEEIYKCQLRCREFFRSGNIFPVQENLDEAFVFEFNYEKLAGHVENVVISSIQIKHI